MPKSQRLPVSESSKPALQLEALHRPSRAGRLRTLLYLLGLSIGTLIVYGMVAWTH